MKESVMVTGGAGFIGSHLCEALLKQNFRVVCVDNLSTGSMKNVQDLNKDFCFSKIDVNKNKPALARLFKKHKFSYVFHYAAMVGVKRTQEMPLEVFEDVTGIKNVLSLSHQYSVKKVVYASSSEVYGEPVRLPESEDGPINPHIPYAVVKLLGEKMKSTYHTKKGLRTTSLRFFNVYGEKQEGSGYGFVTSIFINQAKKGMSPTVFGDGLQTRDMVHITDNITASIKCLTNKASDGESINIATGKPTTILDLATTICSLTNPKLKPALTPYPKGRQDIKHRWANPNKMHKILKHKCNTTLKQGLQKTLKEELR